MPTTIYRGTWTGGTHGTMTPACAVTLQSGVHPAAGTYRLTSASLTASSLRNGNNPTTGQKKVRPQINGAFVGPEQSRGWWTYFDSYSFDLTLADVATRMDVGIWDVGITTTESQIILENNGCVWTLTINWEYTFTVMPPIGNAEFGGSATSHFTPVSNTAQHRLRVTLGGETATGALTAAGASSASVAIPAAWMAYMPGQISIMASATLETYIGGGKTGESTCNIVLNVPPGIVPSVGALSIARRGGDPTASTGQYVQSKSLLRLNIGESYAGSYSSIQKWEAAIAGTGYAVNVIGSNGYVDFVPTTSGTISVTITDARGRTATRTIEIAVSPYAAPAFGAVEIGRCTGGTPDENGLGLRINAQIYAHLLGGALTLSILGYCKPKNESAWTSIGSLQSGVVLALENRLDADTVYDVQLIAADGLSTTIYNATVEGTSCLLSIMRNGAGVCFGGVADKAGFVDMKNLRPSGNLVATPNRNLLDNWDFRHPVNQRGITTWPSNDFGLDRWLYQNPSGQGGITVNNGSITVNLISDDGLFQRMDDGVITIGDTYTVSALTSDGLLSATFTARDYVEVYPYANSDLYCAHGYTGGRYHIWPVHKIGGIARPIDIYAVKLERGTVCTLLQDAPMNYADMLRRCQYYFYAVYYYQYQTIGISVEGPEYAFFILPLPTQMRLRYASVYHSAPVRIGYTDRYFPSSELSGCHAILGVNYPAIPNPVYNGYTYTTYAQGVTFMFSCDL